MQTELALKTSREEMKNLHGMALHEMIRFDSGGLHVQILRVPHGWIYSQMDKSNMILSSVFVPWCNSVGAE